MTHSAEQKNRADLLTVQVLDKNNLVLNTTYSSLGPEYYHVDNIRQNLLSEVVLAFNPNARSVLFKAFGTQVLLPLPAESLRCVRPCISSPYEAGTENINECCPGSTKAAVNPTTFVCSPPPPAPNTTTTALSGPNLIGNPSFESPVTASDSYPSFSSQTMQPWMVADTQGDDWALIASNQYAKGDRAPAIDGSQVLTFNTWSWAGHPGGARIYQNVATQAGQTYTLSFKINTWVDSSYVAGTASQ